MYFGTNCASSQNDQRTRNEKKSDFDFDRCRFQMRNAFECTSKACDIDSNAA